MIILKIVFASGLWIGSGCVAEGGFSNLAYLGAVELECSSVVFTPAKLDPLEAFTDITVNGEPYPGCLVRETTFESGNVILHVDCPGEPL